MTDFIYSLSRNLFYDASLEEEYKQSGNWPSDGVIVSESVFMTFSATPPDGKIRVCGADNFPAWSDTPPVTGAELLRVAEYKRTQLMSQANEIIQPLQDAVDLDIATEKEASLLQLWKRYRVNLNRVDTSLAPDIDWPEQPED